MACWQAGNGQPGEGKNRHGADWNDLIIKVPCGTLIYDTDLNLLLKDLNEAGLKTELHAYGTTIEGEWDSVMAAIRRCHETLHSMGAPRINTVIKLGTRVDRDQTMEDKVRSVREKM